jgi:excisionase family DNA binding protein
MAVNDGGPTPRGMIQLLTDSEASELLRLTPRQVAKLARRGDLPSITLPGGEVRFDPDDIRAWVDSLKKPKTEEVPNAS